MFAHREQTAGQSLRVVACESNGRPRTYRLTPSVAQGIAYRRLAAAILGLDVATLGAELRNAREAALKVAA